MSRINAPPPVFAGSKASYGTPPLPTLRVKGRPIPMNRAAFKSAVPYYERYRLGYPQRLIRRVAALLGLAPGDAVLDLGTGPGFLAVPFARLRAWR